MDDGQIIDLYRARSETAISETANKYNHPQSFLEQIREVSAKKRGFGQVPLTLDELQDCIPAAGSVEQTIEDAGVG